MQNEIKKKKKTIYLHKGSSARSGFAVSTLKVKWVRIQVRDKEQMQEKHENAIKSSRSKKKKRKKKYEAESKNRIGLHDKRRCVINDKAISVKRWRRKSQRLSSLDKFLRDKRGTQ